MLLVYWILYLKYIPVFFAVNLPFQVKSLRESLCTSSSVRWTRITVKLQRVWEHQKIKIVTLEPPYKTADLSEPFAWLIRTSYWLNYRNHFLSIIICLELWKTEGLISFILQTRNWDLGWVLAWDHKAVYNQLILPPVLYSITLNCLQSQFTLFFITNNSNYQSIVRSEIYFSSRNGKTVVIIT